MQIYFQIVKSKNTKKSLISTVDKKSNDGKMSEMLRLIDVLKKQLIESQNQVKNLQMNFNKNVSKYGASNQDQETMMRLNLLQQKYDDLDTNFKAQKTNLDFTKKRLLDMQDQLSNERGKTNILERNIRSMELSVKGAHDTELELIEVRTQKDKLELRLKELCSSPFVKDHQDSADLRVKLKTFQQESEQMIKDNALFNQKEQNYKTEIQILKQEIEKKQIDLQEKIAENATLKAQMNIQDKNMGPFMQMNHDDQFMRSLGNLKLQGQKPAWFDLNFLDRPDVIFDDNKSLRDEIQRLKLEKADLASQLEKTQTMLKTHLEIEAENQKLNTIENQKLEMQLKATLLRAEEFARIADLKGRGYGTDKNKFYERNGIKYDDSVSEFSHDSDEEIIQSTNQNYLDLWIGSTELDSDSISSQLQTQINQKNILTFLTIDFYNHDTQNTGVAEGIHTNYDFQVSFKVTTDDFFIKHLETGFIKIELFTSMGINAHKLASANISLKDLVKKQSRDDVSTVVSSTLSLLNDSSNEFIGVIEFKMRMRKSISQTLLWRQQKQDLGILDNQSIVDMNLFGKKKRKLVIKVEKAHSQNPKQNSFVYYQLGGKDYYTKPMLGSNPQWEDHKVVEIMFDEVFITFIRNQPMIFTVFDDNAPLDDDQDNGLIGTAQVSLSDLYNNEIIDQQVDIKGLKGEKKGQLKVQAFWYEGRELEVNHIPEGATTISKTWQSEFTIQICKALRSKSQTLESSFKLFDDDNDGIVCLNDFKKGINILNIQMSSSEIIHYFDKITQPFTQKEFQKLFEQYFITEQRPMTQIKNMLELNTNNIQTNLSSNQISVLRASLKDALKAKLLTQTITQLFSEIDVNKDKKCSLLELIFFIQKLRLPFNEQEIEQFLRQLDSNSDGLLDLQEFIRFIDLQESPIKTSPKIQIRNPLSQQIEQLFNKSIMDDMNRRKISSQELFDQIDHNKNGFLSKKEFQDYCIKLNISNYDIDEMYKYLDINSNGEISVKEFYDAIKLQENNMIERQKSPQFISQKNSQLDSMAKEIFKRIQSGKDKYNISQAFQSYNRGNSQNLSPLIFRQTIKESLQLNYTEQEIQDMFRYLVTDYDQNKQFKEDDFKKAIERYKN